MANLSDKERRALDLLARNPEGCDETTLLVGGVTVGHLTGLVLDGFAAMQATHIPHDGREKSVIWMKITEAGRQVIAE